MEQKCVDIYHVFLPWRPVHQKDGEEPASSVALDQAHLSLEEARQDHAEQADLNQSSSTGSRRPGGTGETLRKTS